MGVRNRVFPLTHQTQSVLTIDHTELQHTHLPIAILLFSLVPGREKPHRWQPLSSESSSWHLELLFHCTPLLPSPVCVSVCGCGFTDFEQNINLSQWVNHSYRIFRSKSC